MEVSMAGAVACLNVNPVGEKSKGYGLEIVSNGQQQRRHAFSCKRQRRLINEGSGTIVTHKSSNSRFLSIVFFLSKVSCTVAVSGFHVSASF
jgi:hypothetical protein